MAMPRDLLSPSTTRTRKLGALVVAAGLALSACGGSTDSATTAGPETTATSQADPGGTTGDAGAETRDEILRLERPTLDGAVFEADTVAGRDVLLWFWAPW